MQIMAIVWAHWILAYKKIFRPSQWVPIRLFLWKEGIAVILNSKSWFSVFPAPWKFYPSDNQILNNLPTCFIKLIELSICLFQILIC